MNLATMLLQSNVGGQFYTFGWQELAIVGTLLVFWLILRLTRSEPGVYSMKMFINLANSKGGNILVLLFLSVYFFRAAMNLFYHGLGLVEAGKFDSTNAVLMMALQFVTGVAFGGAFSAMLKTMSPEDSRTPLPGQLAGSSSSASSSTTSSTSTRTGSVTTDPLSGAQAPATLVPPVG